MNQSLTIKEKIGQRFIIGINSDSIDDIIYLIKEYAIGGVVLYKSGINMNLAPVMDIDNNSKSKATFKRCFYGDLDEISKYSKEYIDTMEKEKIIAVAKHYPGHGITKLDSHFFVPYIFNYKLVLDRHIKPFKEIINDIDALMIGHLIIRKVTGLFPASISKKLVDDLRENYDGIIMTDEVKMLDRNIVYRWNYLKRAMLAGDDINFNGIDIDKVNKEIIAINGSIT